MSNPDNSISLDNPLYKHLSELVILWAISEQNELTGYQIQKTYLIKHSHRILKKLAEKSLLIEREDTQSGRLQKKYKITTKGKERLSELITEWEDKFVGMKSILRIINPDMNSDANIRKQKFEKISEELEKRKNKDDFIDYLDNYLSYLKIINNNSYQLKKKINNTIKNINESEIFDPDDYLEDLYETLGKVTTIFDIKVPKISDLNAHLKLLKSLNPIFNPFGGEKKGN
jgi:DNA-binding PadR family transcriptional regulator